MRTVPVNFQLLLGMILCGQILQAQGEQSPEAVARWSFEKPHSLEIQGKYQYAMGIHGDGVPRLLLNGKDIPVGDQFRYGIEYDVEGNSKLIVYVEAQYTNSTSFEILPVENPTEALNLSPVPPASL